ncbi:MAG TPA: guanylate kinase [Gemmatales bacterium]|nr:guanylate kinase [Gemmatales bacterium]
MSNETGAAAGAAPRPGKLFILSGPSGSGKSTVIGRALAAADLPIRLAVSATTRAPRNGEIDGVHYHFWTPDRFAAAIQAGEFLEWADVYGNFYGTLRSEVDGYLAQGQSVLLEIDVQGGQQMREKRPDAVLVFIRTSTSEEYEARLRQRRTDDEASLQRRLVSAPVELAVGQSYQHQLINDDLDEAAAALRSIFRREVLGGDACSTT